MAAVVSLGSVNVDHVAYVESSVVAALADEYDWFPGVGETVSVPAIPTGFEHHVDEIFPGGKGANQAVAAARAGAATALLGMVGDDHAEYEVLDSLAGHGVDVEGVGVADAPTGSAHVFVTPDGENHIVITAGANGAVDPAYVRRNRETLLGADCLLVQNELPTATLDAALSALDGADDRPTVIFDPAPAAGARTLLAHPCVDFVTPNESEYAALRDALADFGGTVVRTRGPDPVVIEPEGGAAGEDERFAVEPPPVDPVDTTGAGDVFAGYLAARLAAGAPLRAAVEIAAAAAALSTERPGVQRATPDADVVRAFRERRE